MTARLPDDPTNAMAYLGMAAVLHSLSNSEREEAFMQAEQRGYSSSLGSVLFPERSAFPDEGEDQPPYLVEHSSSSYCVHGHKNPPGSVWCEQCEEQLRPVDSFVL